MVSPPAAPLFSLPVLWRVLLIHCSHYLYYGESFSTPFLTTHAVVSPSAPLFSLPVLWRVLLIHCSHYLYYSESFWSTVLTTCTIVSPSPPLFSLPVLWWVLMHSCSCSLYYGKSCYTTLLTTVFAMVGEFCATVLIQVVPLFALPLLCYDESCCTTGHATITTYMHAHILWAHVHTHTYMHTNACTHKDTKRPTSFMVGDPSSNLCQWWW